MIVTLRPLALSNIPRALEVIPLAQGTDHTAGDEDVFYTLGVFHLVPSNFRVPAQILALSDYYRVLD